MIYWNHANGVVGTYRTGEWVGEQDLYETGIILTYSSTKKSKVFQLDGNIPNGIGLYLEPEKNRVVLHGIVQVSDIYNTYKFVLRAESEDGSEVDDLYCEFIVDNTINIDGEALGWKTTQADIPDTWTSYSQPVVVNGSSSSQMIFQLNSSVGNQTFYKIFGELPPGIQIETNGYLTGVFEGVEEPTKYDFTVRCDVSGLYNGTVKTFTFDREFYIIVNPATDMINPVFINDNLFLNNIDYGTYVEFNVSAFIIPSHIITYAITKGNLPAGLSLGTYSGAITGYCLETSENKFEFEVTAYCDDTGGQSSHIYQIGTNVTHYLSDKIIPENGSAFSAWKIGDYVYQEIIIENSEHYYTFNTNELYKVLPTGLAVSFFYKQISADQFQSICIISGQLQPQSEGTRSFTLYWERENIRRSASFTMTILTGKSSDLSKLYVQLPHEFLSDWVEQYEVFTTLPENNVYGDFKREYAIDEDGNVIVDSNGNPVPLYDEYGSPVIDYNNRNPDEIREFDNLVYNLNTDVYAFKYLPKIYLVNSCSLSDEELDNVVGSYNYPLSFHLSNIKYSEYKNKNGELVYYVLYRDVIDDGFGEAHTGKKRISVDADNNIIYDDNGQVQYIYDDSSIITYTSPTFSDLRDKILAADSSKTGISNTDELLEWQNSWSPILILMYIRPNALTRVLTLLNQFNDRFISKRYTAQYLCKEPYFTNSFKESVIWFQSYNSLNPVKDWRDGQYYGNTPIQPLNPYPEMPTVQKYNIITDYNTQNYPEYNIITDSNDSLVTEDQLIISDPE